MLGSGVKNILSATLGVQGGGMLVGGVVLVAMLLCYAIVVRGVHVLNVFNKFVTPGLIAVTGLLFYAIFSRSDWATLAAVGSTLLTVGLGLRLLVARRSAEIAGAIGIAVGLGTGAPGATLTAVARQLRTSSRPAVVVVPEARLVDRSGRALPNPRPDEASVPEGALVYVHSVETGLVEIEWGSLEGWLSAAQVRMFAGVPAKAK